MDLNATRRCLPPLGRNALAHVPQYLLVLYCFHCEPFTPVRLTSPVFVFCVVALSCFPTPFITSLHLSRVFARLCCLETSVRWPGGETVREA